MDMFDEPTSSEVAGNLSYLKGARQDPSPWEDQGGVPTGPMTALTPFVLEEMDQERSPSFLAAERPVQRLTRVQARRLRKARQRMFALALGLVSASAFISAFLIAYLFL